MSKKITTQEYMAIQNQIESEVIRLNKIYQDVHLTYYKIPCDIERYTICAGHELIEEIVYLSPIGDNWTTCGFYAYHEIPDSDCYPICCRWRTNGIPCDPSQPLFPPNSTIEEKVKLISACLKKSVTN
jgi:hypothetical protein